MRWGLCQRECKTWRVVHHSQPIGSKFADAARSDEHPRIDFHDNRIDRLNRNR